MSTRVGAAAAQLSEIMPMSGKKNALKIVSVAFMLKERPCIGDFNRLFLWPEPYHWTGRDVNVFLVDVFLVDEKPTVVLVGSAGKRLGGARRVP
jgi:hypothetical protein